MLVFASSLLALCEPWCEDACSNLNGNAAVECGECKEPQYSCRPGAPDFADFPVEQAVLEVPVEPIGTNDRLCHDVLGQEECDQNVRDGRCTEAPTYMAILCPRTCQLCDHDLGGATWMKCPSDNCMQASLDDFREQGASSCPDAEKFDEMVARRCDDLEDQSRLKDRGFFVVRNAVPAKELSRMVAHVRSIPHPTQKVRPCDIRTPAGGSSQRRGVGQLPRTRDAQRCLITRGRPEIANSSVARRMCNPKSATPVQKSSRRTSRISTSSSITSSPIGSRRCGVATTQTLCSRLPPRAP